MNGHAAPPGEANSNGPTEESPLLNHVGDPSGNSFGSAANFLEVAKTHSNGHANGNGVRHVDHEEQSIGSNDEPLSGSKGFENVARVISVLLIGELQRHI